MIPRLALAAALALATSAAHAAGPGPQLVGGMTDAEVVYNGGPMGTLVGGALVSLDGGGDDRRATIAWPQGVPGRIATLLGGGVDAELRYAPAGDTRLGALRTGTGR